MAMAVATGASRMSGFARTVALASALGVTAVGDAYNTANTVPNMVFTLVVGGILTSAVVPILVQSTDDRDAAELAGALLSVTLVVGIVASTIVAVAAPYLVRVLTSGASRRTDYEAYVVLTTNWLRWFAPQIGLYAVGVLAVSIMTAKRRLFLGAAAPIITNAVTIAVALLAVRGGERGLSDVSAVSAHKVTALGAGTTVAVAAATAIQLWGAHRTTPGLRLRWNPGHRAVRGLVRRGRWMILYVGANQVGLAVVVAIATTTRGGVSAYQWAFTLMQLPYALIAVSVVTAAYPAISRAAQNGRSVDPEVRRAGGASVRLLVPAAIGLLVLAVPISTIVVGPPGASLVAAAAGGFAISLVPFTIFQLLTRVCYAYGDTRTPAIINVGVNMVNVAGAVVLVAIAATPSHRLLALAVAHGLSYVVGVAGLLFSLVRRQVLSIRSVLGGQRATVIAATVMGAVIWPVSRTYGVSDSREAALLTCAALATVGAGVFAGGLRLTRLLDEGAMR